MLIAMENPDEISLSQMKLVEYLRASFRHVGKRKIGFQGDSFECDIWAGANIWFATKTISGKGTGATGSKRIPRYWNAFGLSDEIDTSVSLSIVVEINIPQKGINRKVGGLFVRNSISGNISLVHRGLVGGGRKNIGKEAFLRWNSKERTRIKFHNKLEEELVVVSRLGSKAFLEDLDKFVMDVAEFKSAIRTGLVNEASFLSREELEKRAMANSRKPTAREIKTNSYHRDPYISEFAKVRAAGKCQLCGKKAPFIDQLGKPYLETHHVTWLAKGGSDSVKNTVALCPNCHRRMHIRNDPTDKSILIDIAKNS